MSLLGGFGRSAHTRGWAVLDGLHSKEIICCEDYEAPPTILDVANKI